MPNVTLEKEMYDEARQKGLSFTEFLSREVEPGDEELDAFQKQLKKHKIIVDGADISLVEDFYRTYESSVLFPEFINRNVRIGMEMGRNQCQISDLIATTQQLPGDTYRSIEAAASSGEKGAFRVGQRGEFPTTVISTTEKPVSLMKIGHKLEATYEVLRRVQVDLIALHIQLIGRKLRDSVVAWALDVIVNGDGNSNPAPTFSQTGLNYNNFVDFDMEWPDYEATVFVGAKAAIAGILKLSEFKDPQAGFNYQATGNLISPLGVVLRKDASVAANSLIGVDRNAALEMLVEAGSQFVEADKVIDKQFEKTVISQVTGFAKIYLAASKVWDYS
jgi:hypothetical protein